jgi:hypothetical protein
VIHALPSRFFQSILDFLQYSLRFPEIVILGHYRAITPGGWPLGHVRFGPTCYIRVDHLISRVVLLMFLIIIQQVSLVPSRRQDRGAVRLLIIEVRRTEQLFVKRIRQLLLPHLNHGIEIAHALGLEAIQCRRAIVLEEVSILRVKVLSHSQVSRERAAPVG